MGWKTSTILISPTKKIDYQLILERLEIGRIHKGRNAKFEEVINPQNVNEFFFGYLNNCIIICADVLPLTLIKKKVTEKENTLSNLFTDSEICALALHSGTGYFALSISKNGKKSRVLSGADDKIEIDFGYPVQEENRFAQAHEKFRIKIRSLTKDFSSDHGENIVFSIFERHLGFNIATSSIEIR